MGITLYPLVRNLFALFLLFGYSVGDVSGLGYGVVAPTIVKS